MRAVAAIVLSLIASSATALDGARLSVEPASFDFGRLRFGVTVSKTFLLSNVGGETLVIEKVTKDCGCTVVSGWKARLAPGESTELRVSLSSGPRAGVVERRVVVKSNDAVRPQLEVKIRAEVVGR